MDTYDCIRTLQGHKSVIHSLVIVGDRLISCDSNKTVSVMNFLRRQALVWQHVKPKK